MPRLNVGKHPVAAAGVFSLYLVLGIAGIQTFAQEPKELPERWEVPLGAVGSSGCSVVRAKDGRYVFATVAKKDKRRVIGLIELSSSGAVTHEQSIGEEVDHDCAMMVPTPDAGMILVGSRGNMNTNRDVLLVKIATRDGTRKVDWTKTFGTAQDEYGYSLAVVGRDGYLILAGSHRSGAGKSGNEAYLIRVDAAGEFVWEKRLEGTTVIGTARVLPASDGGFVFLAERTDSRLLELRKVNSRGESVWRRSYPGMTTAFFARSRRRSTGVPGEQASRLPKGAAVAPARDGGWLLASEVGTTSNVLFVRTDSEGEVLWERLIGSESEDFVHGLWPASDGGWMLTGARAYELSGGRQFPRNGVSGIRRSRPGSAWAVRIDSRGEFLWDQTFGRSSRGILRSARETDDGGWVFAGTSSTSLAVRIPPRSSGGVHAVRYRDGLYFRAEVDAHAYSTTGWVPTPRVVSGDAFHVCALAASPTRVYALPAESAPSTAARRLEEEYRSLNEEIVEKQRELRALKILEASADGEEASTLARKVSRTQAEISRSQSRVRHLSRMRAEAQASRFRGLSPRGGSGLEIVGRASGAGVSVLELPGREAGAEGHAFKIEIPESVKAVDRPPGWLTSWAAAYLERQSASGSDPDYFSYLRATTRRRFVSRDERPGRALPRRIPDVERRVQDVRLYDLFTGSSAIRESAQMDRFLASALGNEGQDKNAVHVADIEPLQLDDHPFEEMREGRPFRASALSKLCPRDALYLRVASVADWLRLRDLTKEWGGSLLETIVVSGRDRGLFRRYAEQLALGDELSARLVGQKVIGEMAILASDPLFAEGTAIAVVLSPVEGRQKLFQAALAAQRASHAAADGVRRETLRVEDLEVEVLSTDDRRIRSYLVSVGEQRILCNSRELLTRILRASRDVRESLWNAADFRYYRALYPLDDEETAFAFLSQDWFRRITGPAWRIAHGRRRVASHEMRIAHYAWQTALVNRAKADLGSLEVSGFLPSDFSTRFPLSLDAVTGDVQSSTFGHVERLRPVDELLPGRVSVEEKKLYDAFRESYSRYWRQFIDPVGVRLRAGDESVNVETLILPLIENSVYRQLQEFTGGLLEESSSVVRLPSTALGAVTFRWEPDAVRLDQMLPRQFDLDPAWLGDTIALGVADGDLFLTPATEGAGFFGSGNDVAESLAVGSLISSLTLPTFAAIELRDRVAVERYLEIVLAVLAGQPSSFVRLKQYEASDVPGLRTVVLSVFVVELRIHFAFSGKWLLVSTRPDLLREWARSIEAEDGAETFAENGRLVLLPESFKQAARTMGIRWEERVLAACTSNLGPLERAEDAGWFDRAESFLGFRCRCPSGGQYRAGSNRVSCSKHGTSHHPMQPFAVSEKAQAVRIARLLRSLEVGFRFTGDGLRSRLTIRLRRE